MDDEPMLKNRKMTREQMFEAQRVAEEQEKEKMKQIMISICTFLEEKYTEEIKNVTLARDPNLHYDINFE
jgi:hypothetical protein